MDADKERRQLERQIARLEDRMPIEGQVQSARRALDEARVRLSCLEDLMHRIACAKDAGVLSPGQELEYQCPNLDWINLLGRYRRFFRFVPDEG